MSAEIIHINSELFRRVADGDEQAFRSVFDLFWPQVYGTSLRLVKNPEQAKDLSQEIFIKLWENRDKLPGTTNPAGYIYQVSRNLVIDHLRKKVFSAENIDNLLHYFQDNSDDAAAKTELKELETTLHAAVDALPERVRTVFQLSRIDGLTHEQIAERLGISVVSSKTYIVRALAAIRQYMETHSGEPLILLAFLLLLD